ncbi:MAG: TolC family protein [Desulfobacterales bacterium]|nr:TolC family protein [Desulfobacterales bacterium]
MKQNLINTGFKIVWMILGIIGISISCHAASLKELQEMSIANRNLVKYHQQKLEKQTLEITRQQGKFEPTVNFQYGNTQMVENTNKKLANQQTLFTAQVSYNLFSGFRNKYDLSASQLSQKVGEHEMNSILQEIKYQVALTYLDANGKKLTQAIVETEYSLLKKRHEDAVKKHAVGLINKNEVLKISVELDNALQKMKETQADYLKSINSLGFQVNTDIKPASLTFEEYENLPQIRDIAYYKEQMMQNKQEILALQALEKTREYLVLSAKSGVYPKIDVAMQYNRSGDDLLMGTSGNNNDDIRVLLSGTINLFDGKNTYCSIQQAKLDLRMVRCDIDELTQKLMCDLKNNLIDYETHLENIDVSKKGIEQAEENLRVSENLHQQGLETTTDLLDAILHLSRAKYNYIYARNTLFLNYYMLLRLIDGF